MTIFDSKVNSNIVHAYNEGKIKPPVVYSMLFLRTGLFLLCQTVVYCIYLFIGASEPWESSANWWSVNVIAVNLICVLILKHLLKKEDKNFSDFFIIDKSKIIKNTLQTLLLVVISIPIAMIPNMLLAYGLFGSYEAVGAMFFRPLPLWAALISLIFFPLTMPLGELTVYFGYTMPRIEAAAKKKLPAIILPALTLSVQHAALPLIFDIRFILWRMFMFLPFAFLLALIIRRKPNLFPYLLVGHFLIDIMTGVSVLTASI